jgi:hypothetical protein
MNVSGPGSKALYSPTFCTITRPFDGDRVVRLPRRCILKLVSCEFPADFRDDPSRRQSGRTA